MEQEVMLRLENQARDKGNALSAATMATCQASQSSDYS